MKTIIIWRGEKCDNDSFMLINNESLSPSICAS